MGMHVQGAGSARISYEVDTLMAEARGGSSEANAQGGGWADIVARVSSYASSAPKVSNFAPQEAFRDLSGLLRLQREVTQYQLRVELVSKVAESAVASLRKLQQSQ